MAWDKIANVGAQVLGLGLGQLGAGQQYRRQKEMMGLQLQNQQTLNQQGHDLAFDMWKKTNYSATADEMRKAGLNVGLMYGQGGGGGGTATTGSGGSASGGNAPMADMGLGMQLGMNQKQMELVDAQINKTNAEADNLRGVQKDNIASDTALKAMQTANLEILNNLNNKTLDEQITAIKANADKAQSEARTALVNANVDETTQKSKEEQIKNESIASALEAGLKQTKINLDNATIKNMAEQIAIGKFNANQQAEFKGLDQVAGSQVNKLINKIYSIFGVKEETETQNKIK